VTPADVAQEIMRTIAHEYGVTMTEVRSPSRVARLVRVRHLIAYVIRQSTTLTTTEIANMIGRTDHTTTLHALRRIEAELAVDEGMRSLVDRYVRRWERWPSDAPFPTDTPQPRLPL
jgi:chromosomal replication initiator protein